MTHTPNFLEAGAPTPRPKRWPWVLLGVIALLGLLAFILARPVTASYRAWRAVIAGKEALARAETRGLALDLGGTDVALGEALAHFTTASLEIEKLGAFRRVPWIGRNIRATDDLLRTGVDTISAAREVLSFGRDLFGVIQDIEVSRLTLAPEFSPTTSLASLTPSEKRRILAQFVMSVPKLEAAREKIDQALLRFEEIPTRGLVGPLRQAIEPLAEQLPRFRDDIDRFTPIAKLLPSLAGYPAPNKTLVLFLNNTELRPGGGFVGSIGRFDVADATLVSFETKDAYQVDRPAEPFLFEMPPAPLTQYLGVTRLFMRDANWSPDFSVSAETVATFYERETSGGAMLRTIDNVIGLTPTFASELLRITGPIAVDDQVFTAENLYDTLEYQVEKGFTERGIPFEQRKEILVKLVEKTVERLLTLPFNRWEDVLRAIDEGFREKQLILYDRDTAIQEVVEAQDWGGVVSVPDHDFLMVVDANLGSLKSDPFVKRRIDYHIEPEGNGYRAEVSITYRHEGRFDWKTTRYRTYTRLYVPAGSEFLTASGHLRDDKLKNPSREPGVVDVGPAEDVASARVFGTFTAIEPGEERTLIFAYRLAPEIVEQIRNGEYQLTVGKQLGAFPYELTLDLDFGKTLTEASPPETPEQFFDSRYRVWIDLAEGRYFRVQF